MRTATYAGQPVQIVAVNGAWPEALVRRSDGTDVWVALAALSEDSADPDPAIVRQVATDLLHMHTTTSLSLDKWAAARTLVEHYHGPITENHA